VGFDPVLEQCYQVCCTANKRISAIPHLLETTHHQVH